MTITTALLILSLPWLNLVERWFREITDKRIRRGVFQSVERLIGAIRACIDEHNENLQPFVWTAKAGRRNNVYRLPRDSMESFRVPWCLRGRGEARFTAKGRRAQEGPPTGSSSVDHALDAVLDENDVPVHEEAKSMIREFEVRQQLINPCGEA